MWGNFTLFLHVNIIHANMYFPPHIQKKPININPFNRILLPNKLIFTGGPQETIKLPLEQQYSCR